MTTAQQKDLLTNRWRQVRRPDPKESQIQIQLIAELKFRIRPGVMYWHTPNGELRADRTGAKLKAMGALAGVPDLIFIWNDHKSIQQPSTQVLFLELKRNADAALSPEQWAFKLAIEKTGAVFDWAASVGAAMSILRSHGLLKN